MYLLQVVDCQDECPHDGLKTLRLVCGCGVTEADSDGDQVLDCVDDCPNDALKTGPVALRAPHVREGSWRQTCVSFIFIMSITSR